VRKILIEKPQYGWYVKNLIIGFNIIGLIGVFALIFGIVVQGVGGLILILVGIAIILVFLWPGVGMIAMHLFVLGKINLIDKMEPLRQLENPQILDVGCGTGRTAIRIAKELKDGGHLYGIDIYSQFAIGGNSLETVQNNARIEGVQDKTTFQIGSATEVPFDNESFDIVDISSVMHEIHGIKGQEKAMQELYRVLKPGGYLYLNEWNRISLHCIAMCGICCLVFRNKNHWDRLLRKYKFKDIQYESKMGFGIFIARK
jgi:ubiquinone/menaquinone biosynthesis C-methylase UbiE